MASATLRTASSKAGAVLSDVVWTPLTFRTYWRAAASISSAVASGSRPRSVVMFRHMRAGYAAGRSAADAVTADRLPLAGGGGGGGHGDCLGQWLGAGWAGIGDGAAGQ